MSISEIKQQINTLMGVQLPTLNMQVQMAEDGVTPTDWVSHWDNDHRIRITMHDDVAKTASTSTTLAYKREDVPAREAVGEVAARAAYTKFMVVQPKNIKYSF